MPRFKFWMLILYTFIAIFGAVSVTSAQQAVELNVNISTEFRSTINSPTVQSEIELGYKHRVYRIKNQLFLYGKASGFMQIDPLTWSATETLDASQYDYRRFGGSAIGGLSLQQGIVTPELEFGVTTHRVVLDRMSTGLLPPGTEPTSPEQITGWFYTFDTRFTLGLSLSNSINGRFSLRVQAPLNESEYNNPRLSPTLGLEYLF